MSAAPQMSARERWHQIATNLALGDAEAIGVLPAGDRNLNKLPTDKREQLIRKLDELVTAACAAWDSGNVPRDVIHEQLAKDVWNFVKTLKPDLEPFSQF